MNETELRDAIATAVSDTVNESGWSVAVVADAVLDVVRPEIELHVEVAAAWMSDFAATTAERERVLLGIIDLLAGVPGADYTVERWEREYEGWAGMYKPTCDGNHNGPTCCFHLDGINLTAEQLAFFATRQETT